MRCIAGKFFLYKPSVTPAFVFTQDSQGEGKKRKERMVRCKIIVQKGSLSCFKFWYSQGLTCQHIGLERSLIILRHNWAHFCGNFQENLEETDTCRVSVSGGNNTIIKYVRGIEWWQHTEGERKLQRREDSTEWFCQSLARMTFRLNFCVKLVQKDEAKTE